MPPFAAWMDAADQFPSDEMVAGLLELNHIPVKAISHGLGEDELLAARIKSFPC